ncbi:MAG: PQQ-dependent sugar dehydrogenase [Luteolibacter sp.]
MRAKREADENTVMNEDSNLKAAGVWPMILMSAVSTAMAFGQGVSPADYESFAMSHAGDVARGRAAFLVCATCHSVDGTGSTTGPDLGLIGDNFRRLDLIRAILEPSASVAVGFGATSIETTSGETRIGIVKSATAELLEMMGVDGKLVKIPVPQIKSQQQLDISLMPAGLHAAFPKERFADLIAYLESLRSTAAAVADKSGALSSIPMAGKLAEFEPLFAEPFDYPTWFGWIPGRAIKNGLVLEHAGRIWVTEKNTRRLFLDISSIVRRGGATGLLGIAFHPDFENDRRYYIKYQMVENGVISTVIDERKMKPKLDEDSGQPSRRIIKITSVTQDHNGGSIGFGPDGFLYFGMGDTGPQRDPQGHGQDMGILLGKLLRIDVDRSEGALAYAIPADNPFVGKAGVRPEIWAYGFREPWRICWDSKTKDLWVGDVGQDRVEEVGIVRCGENHGWNVYEGHQAFSDGFRRAGEKYVPPVLSYTHRIGLSVTGGEVYHGSRAPKLEGWYVFGDYDSRRVWALTQQDRKLGKVVEIGRSPARITSFARDDDGELYVIGFDNGIIYKMNLDNVDPRPLETRVLAATSEKSGMKWRFTTQHPPEAWAEDLFDDREWSEGLGGFGTEGTPGGIIRTNWQTADLWLRREFEISPEMAAANGEYLLRLHHDEDAEVFINGVQVLNASRWTQGYIEEKVSTVQPLKPGRNVIAVHCHQNGGGQFIDVGLLKTVEPR